MGQLIKSFPNGTFLEYDRGSFDQWCVYLTDVDGKRKPPRDMDYFTDIKNLADQYGVDKVYEDYVRVYDLTGKEVSSAVLDTISQISQGYQSAAIQVDILFSILYMAMIAEEKKRGTRLGKRIKRLGIHYLLIENKPVNEAANFMRGMGWRDIDRLCVERGF